MRLKTQLLPVLAAGLLFAACQADDIPGPDAKELYNRDFIKNFGVFDANHDWNMATQAGVTVSSATPTDVKIYAVVNGSRYLFGTFQGVTGNRILSVDVPKGTGRLIVNANGRDHDVAVGANITLDSRLITEGNDDMLKWAPSRNRMLPTTGLKQYLDLYPEGEANLGHTHTSFYFVADGKEHTFYPFYWDTDKAHALGIYYLPDSSKPDNIVMQDLYFTKSGELKYAENTQCNPAIPKGTSFKAGEEHLFGAYKYTAKEWEELGVFPGIYLVESDIENPTYTDWDGAKQTQWQNLKYKNGEMVFKNGEIHLYDEENAILRTAHGYISRVLYKNETFVLSETVLESYSYPADFEIAESGFRTGQPDGKGPVYSMDGVDHITTRGVTYSLPAGTLYGFYIKCGYPGGFFDVVEKDGEKVYVPKPESEQIYNFTVFSQASRNRDFVDDKGRNDVIRSHNWSEKTWWDDEKFTELDKYAYASWGQVEMGGKKYSMFGFEDWEAANGSSMADLNDVMFLFDTNLEPTNVIVEKPEAPTPSFMWIVAAEDLGITDFDFNDVVFGVTNPVSDSDGNKTTQIYPLAAGGTMPVYLYYNKALINPEGTADGEFHSWFRGNHDSTKPINVGGYAAEGDPYTLAVRQDFTMACCTEGTYTNMGGFTIKVDKTADYEEHTITPPDHTAGITAAPQMICLGTQWFWPTEMTHIWDPYPGFLDWCQDRNTAHNWHDHANIPEEHSGRVVRHNFGAGESGGGDTPIDPGKDPETPDPVKPTIPAGSVLMEPVEGPIDNWGSPCYRYEIPAALRETINNNGEGYEITAITLFVEMKNFDRYDAGYVISTASYIDNYRSSELVLYSTDMFANGQSDKATKNFGNLKNNKDIFITYWEAVSGFIPGYVSIKVETNEL